MNLEKRKDYFLTTMEANRSPKTIRWYRDKLDRLVEFLNERCAVSEVEDLQPKHLHQFFVYLRDERQCSIETRRGYFTTTRKLLRWLEDIPGYEGLYRRLMKDIDPPRSQKRVIEALSMKEVDRLLTKVRNRRDKAILVTFLSTGIRAGELANLQVDDVNFDAGHIIIRRAAFGRAEGAKNGRERYVALTKSLRSVLADYLGRVRPRYADAETPWLFPTRGSEGFSVTGLYRLVRRYLEKAGIHKEQMGPHLLRRTFASATRSRGIPKADLAELMGHSASTGTTVLDQSYVTHEANIAALAHAPDILDNKTTMGSYCSQA